MEISEVFRDELKEEFAKLELFVLNLEKGDSSHTWMEQAKRILHNMKGSARVAGFEACGRVIHHMETLLIEKPLEQILEHLLSGMDTSLGLVQPDADESEAERFIERTFAKATSESAQKLPTSLPITTPKTCRPKALEHQVDRKKSQASSDNRRVLICGDRAHLLEHHKLFTDNSISVQWKEDTTDIALLLQEQVFDAVVLDFSSLQLTQGNTIRKIRRVSESLPIILLAETFTPCLLVQVSRLENVSCFWRPMICPQTFIRHLQKRMIMSRQCAMFSRALRVIWYLDPKQDPRMELDARSLMRYQDNLRNVGSSNEEWDFENCSQIDKRLALVDVHDEIELVLHDLMLRMDQKSLPLSLVRLRHKHLLDCVLQHFLEENAMMQGPDHSKKFLEQHIKHHDDAIQEFLKQRMITDLDGIRFFCDRVAHFIRQHASFDHTLEEYLLRE